MINLQDGVWSVWVGVNLPSCWKRYHKKRRYFDCSHTLVLHKIWFKVYWRRWQCKSMIRICYIAVLLRLSIMIKNNLMVSAYTWIWYFFQKTLTDSDVGREILPDGWSVTETYALRYVHNNSLYILKGVKTEADIVLNLLVWCTVCSEVSGRDTLNNTSLLRH